MRRFLQFGLLGLLIASQLHAAELANLRNGFSIRHQRHETAGETTRLYMNAAPDSGYIDVPTAEIEGFEPAPPDPQEAAVTATETQDLNSIVSAASTRNQVDADFIASVIRAESANNPRAVSPKGAQGLMQLMPQTASKLGVKNSFDAAENVDGGVRYLRELLLLYNNDMIKALAAYNAGPAAGAAVQRFAALPRDPCLRGACHQGLQPQEAGQAQGRLSAGSSRLPARRDRAKNIRCHCGQRVTRLTLLSLSFTFTL